MALVIELRCVEFLTGKCDRVVRLTFRGHTYESNVVRSAKRVAYFGQTFEWPLARNITSDETVNIQLFNYNKYLANKIVGTYSLYAQQLVQNGELSVNEPLVGSNNRMLEATINFDVRYFSPDGKVGNFTSKSDFMSPIISDGDNVDGGLAGLLDDMPIFVDQMPGDAEQNLLPGEDTASQNVLIEKIFGGKKIPPELYQMELHRPKDFEVRVTIVQAQQLAGLDIDPVVRVDVGPESRYTNISKSTNCPYYNEYFVFDFHEPAAMILDKMITISVSVSVWLSLSPGTY